VFCAGALAEEMGESVDIPMKFVVKGWRTTGALKKTHMMHGMSVIAGSNKEIMFRCEDFAIYNCCQYKEIPFCECQRNVKECKRMSHAFEEINLPISSEGD
jgi:hypothetical protein